MQIFAYLLKYTAAQLDDKLLLEKLTGTLFHFSRFFAGNFKAIALLSRLECFKNNTALRRAILSPSEHYFSDSRTCFIIPDCDMET